MRRKQGGGLSSTFEIPEVCQVESPPQLHPRPADPTVSAPLGANDAPPRFPRAANQPHSLPPTRNMHFRGKRVFERQKCENHLCSCLPLAFPGCAGTSDRPAASPASGHTQRKEGRPSVGGGKVSLLGRAPLAGLLEMPAHLVTSRRRHSKHSVSRFPVLILKQAVPIYLS